MGGDLVIFFFKWGLGVGYDIFEFNEFILIKVFRILYLY